MADSDNRCNSNDSLHGESDDRELRMRDCDCWLDAGRCSCDK